MFAPDAFRLSHGLEGNKRTLKRLLLLFNKHNKEHLQIHTHVEFSNARHLKTIPDKEKN